jgi:hypothetical protein
MGPFTFFLSLKKNLNRVDTFIGELSANTRAWIVWPEDHISKKSAIVSTVSEYYTLHCPTLLSR